MLPNPLWPLFWLNWMRFWSADQLCSICYHRKCRLLIICCRIWILTIKWVAQQADVLALILLKLWVICQFMMDNSDWLKHWNLFNHVFLHSLLAVFHCTDCVQFSTNSLFEIQIQRQISAFACLTLKYGLPCSFLVLLEGFRGSSTGERQEMRSGRGGTTGDQGHCSKDYGLCSWSTCSGELNDASSIPYFW